MAALQEWLYPNANGAKNQVTSATLNVDYLKIDEPGAGIPGGPGTDDGSSSYNLWGGGAGPSVGEWCGYGVPFGAIGPDSIVSALKFFLVHYRSGGTSLAITPSLKINGTWYQHVSDIPQTAGAAWTDGGPLEWALNPATGLPWTSDDINGVSAYGVTEIRMEITSEVGVVANYYTTQIHLYVEYLPPKKTDDFDFVLAGGKFNDLDFVLAGGKFNDLDFVITGKPMTDLDFILEGKKPDEINFILAGTDRQANDLNFNLIGSVALNNALDFKLAGKIKNDFDFILAGKPADELAFVLYGAVITDQADRRLTLLDTLKLRSTGLFAQPRDLISLKLVYGDLTSSQVPCEPLDEAGTLFHVSDRPIMSINAVYADGSPVTYGYQAFTAYQDETGAAMAVVRFSNPQYDKKISVSCKGIINPTTGGLIENPADLIQDILLYVQNYIDDVIDEGSLAQFRIDCDTNEVRISCVLDEDATIKNVLDEIAYNIHARWLISDGKSVMRLRWL